MLDKLKFDLLVTSEGRSKSWGVALWVCLRMSVWCEETRNKTRYCGLRNCSLFHNSLLSVDKTVLGSLWVWGESVENLYLTSHEHCEASCTVNPRCPNYSIWMSSSLRTLCLRPTTRENLLCSSANWVLNLRTRADREFTSETQLSVLLCAGLQGRVRQSTSLPLICRSCLC